MVLKEVTTSFNSAAYPSRPFLLAFVNLFSQQVSLTDPLTRRDLDQHVLSLLRRHGLPSGKVLWLPMALLWKALRRMNLGV
jgi:hypothetical protein